jgi:hypothetical protein
MRPQTSNGRVSIDLIVLNVIVIESKEDQFLVVRINSSVKLRRSNGLRFKEKWFQSHAKFFFH